MNEKSESELKNVLELLNDEKNKIKELNNIINDKVNEFHATVIPKQGLTEQPSQPGIMGRFHDLLKELVNQRQLMEQTVKELTSIVG